MILAYFVPEDPRLRVMAERDIAGSGSDDVAVSPAHERHVRLEAALGRSPVGGPRRDLHDGH